MISFFCLEVFEHLPPAQTIQALKDLHKYLSPDGFLTIGVPNELFLPALLKGSLRLVRRFGEVDAHPVHILKAFLGKPPKNREIVSFDGLPYILRHMGFDYRSFAQTLRQFFQINTTFGSPWPILPLGLNFEVYFVCQHKMELS